MEKAIEVKGLRKSFKDTEVLKGVDFEVKRCEIFALLGSNGAGKPDYDGQATAPCQPTSGHGRFTGPLRPDRRCQP